MKTSLKKLTSVFLAVLMVMTVFSVVGVAAADTTKNTAGDDVTIHVTDNLGWGTMYVHYWGGSSESTWPGVQMSDEGDNGFGSHNFSASVPSDATGYVFTKGADGPQTVDVHDVNVEGYWLDGTQTEGKYNVRLWGDTGEGGGQGGGGGSQGGGGGTTGSYYLIGYIDGADYGDGKDYANMGDYHFVNGQVTATFTQDSYVCVKDTNMVWYMTQGFLGTDVTSATLYNSSITGTQSDKLYVPAGTHTFTLSENGDGTLTLSYDGGGDIENPTGGEISGSYTVSVKPGDSYAADGDWYAYTWSGGPGTWVSGSESGGVYTFSGVTDNVIFASASGYPDADWGNCAAQTTDLTAMDGATYVISGKRDPNGDAGEMRPIYEGEWEAGGNIDQPTDPVTDPIINTDPVTDPVINTDPVTDPVINTDPVTDPIINTDPATDSATDPQTNPGGDTTTGLKVTTALNGATINTIDCTGTSVTVTYNLQAPLLLEDGQGTLKYDASKLQIQSFTLPNIQSGLISNKNVAGEAYFNFTGVNAETNSGIFDFKTNKPLVIATFNVVGSGATTINLDMEELDALENGQQIAYYTNKVAAPEASSITQSLANPTVDVQGGDTPTTAPTSQTDPVTTPQTQPSTQVQPTTVVPATQPTTDLPTPVSLVKLSATSKKIAAGKTFKLSVIGASAKAAFSVTSGKKKVALSKKSASQVTVTGLKKGTSKVTVKVNGKTLTCKVTVKNSPKIKVAGKKFKASKTYTINKGKTLKVKITGKAKAIKNKYKSTNKKIAKVTSKKTKANIKIKGLKKGKATIKVTVNKYKTFNIKVKVK